MVFVDRNLEKKGDYICERITKSLLSRCGQFKGRITELQVIAPIYDLKVYAHVQLVVFGTLLCKSQLREI